MRPEVAGRTTNSAKPTRSSLEGMYSAGTASAPTKRGRDLIRRSKTDRAYIMISSDVPGALVAAGYQLAEKIEERARAFLHVAGFAHNQLVPVVERAAVRSRPDMITRGWPIGQRHRPPAISARLADVMVERHERKKMRSGTGRPALCRRLSGNDGVCGCSCRGVRPEEARTAVDIRHPGIR